MPFTNVDARVWRRRRRAQLIIPVEHPIVSMMEKRKRRSIESKALEMSRKTREAERDSEWRADGRSEVKRMLSAIWRCGR